MCGILGLFPGTQEQAKKALEALEHRGKDAQNIISIDENVVGHVLHSLVSFVEQPLQGKGMLLFNGEIYNWKQLCEEESIDAENDSVLLLHLLDTYEIEEVRTKIDGVYAYVYIRGENVIVERDLLGVKPIWYAYQDGLCVASEKKALTELGYEARELHPRSTLWYNTKERQLSRTVRPFTFSEQGDFTSSLIQAVRKRIPKTKEIGVLCSGIDSALLAALAKEEGANVTLYVAGTSNAPDVFYARNVAKKLDCELIVVELTKEDVEQALPKLCSLIESSDVTKIETALPIYFCCKEVNERVVFSGVGADEVFGELQRQKRALNKVKETRRKLRTLYERSLYKDDIVSMAATVEMRTPYLDYAVVGSEGSKEQLRTLAREYLGELSEEPTRAPHFGSRVNKLVSKLAKKTHAEYLKQFYPENCKICSLLSTGKDSVYSLYLMQKRNYPIVCAATILSENKHSYMYHTPTISFAKLQAEALGIPLIQEITAGEKEEELDALREVLTKAKEEFSVEGVVSGAIFSDYQRTRIEQICEELGLYVFAPLWHLDQKSYVEEVIREGFEVILTRVAAYGLDKNAVGKRLDERLLKKLVGIPGMNVAGEGGEYESLVLNGPNFSKRIALENEQIVCEDEGQDSDVCELVAEGTLIQQ